MDSCSSFSPPDAPRGDTPGPIIKHLSPQTFGLYYHKWVHEFPSAAPLQKALLFSLVFNSQRLHPNTLEKNQDNAAALAGILDAARSGCREPWLEPALQACNVDSWGDEELKTLLYTGRFELAALVCSKKTYSLLDMEWLSDLMSRYIHSSWTAEQWYDWAQTALNHQPSLIGQFFSHFDDMNDNTRLAPALAALQALSVHGQNLVPTTTVSAACFWRLVLREPLRSSCNKYFPLALAMDRLRHENAECLRTAAFWAALVRGPKGSAAIAVLERVWPADGLLPLAAGYAVEQKVDLWAPGAWVMLLGHSKMRRDGSFDACEGIAWQKYFIQLLRFARAQGFPGFNLSVEELPDRSRLRGSLEISIAIELGADFTVPDETGETLATSLTREILSGRKSSIAPLQSLARRQPTALDALNRNGQNCASIVSATALDSTHTLFASQIEYILLDSLHLGGRSKKTQAL